MWSRGRLLVTYLLYSFFVTGDFKIYSRKGKQIYGFLDNFQGQKIDQINLVQIPLLLIPVIIVPSINLQENVTTKNNSAEENLDILSNIIATEKVEESLTENDNDDNDIEINFRQSLNRGTKIPKREIHNPETTVKQNNDVLIKNRIVSNTNDGDFNISTTYFSKIKEKTTNSNLTSNDPNNKYPEIIHTSELEPLKLTIVTNEESTEKYNFDEGWQNLTRNRNVSTVEQNKTSLSENSYNLVLGTNATEGAYAASLYNNTMIDQVSITTNSYTNLESLPTQHDRWKAFSSLKRGFLKPTEFRPLAGLYYDGFLHSSLTKMPGFIPHN